LGRRPVKDGHVQREDREGQRTDKQTDARDYRQCFPKTPDHLNVHAHEGRSVVSSQRSWPAQGFLDG
jgi:hypothetical protein